GRHRGGAPARHHHGRGELCLRYRDRGGARPRLRRGRDELDARQRAELSLAAAPDHRGPNPGRCAEVLRGQGLRARAIRPRARRSMTRLILLALLGLMLPPTTLAGELPVVKDRLDTGLTLLVRENPSAAVVAVSLLVRMGSRWETPQIAGISNFVQAVIVKGTTKRNGGEIAEAIAGLGGKLSANGDTDYSEIRGTALARFWRELLGLTAELALEPALLPDRAERERDFLVARLQKREDNPTTRAFDTFFAKLYGAHPYALPTLGTRQSLARIDHQAIVAWYRRFYRPERMVLAFSGQAPAAEVVAEARRLFAALPPATAPAIDPLLPAPTRAGGRSVTAQPAQQTQILMGSLAPRVGDRDYAAVKLLSTVLGG